MSPESIGHPPVERGGPACLWHAGLIGFTLLVHAVAAHAGSWGDLSWSGYLKNETAYRFDEPRSFTKIRNIFSLRGHYPVNDTLELTADGWAYYDLVYDLFDYNTIAARSVRDEIQPLNFIEGLAEEKDSPVAEVRELYLDVFLDNVDLRIGRQFVIWGVMTGVRIVDEINPMDFRELILPDLLDYRIPLWTLKADYYAGDNTLEFLWIPDIRFHKPAPPGSEWELLQDVPCGTQSEPVDCAQFQEVEPNSISPEHAEYGLKLSRMLWDTELSLSYFYTWDDFPVIFRRVPIIVGRDVEEPFFMPRYTRIHMYGMTAQRTVRGQIVKGEFAYVRDKYFGIRAVDRDNDGFVDHQGELRKDHIRWGIGLDFNIWKTDISPGLMQWIILDYDDAIIQDRVDSSFNVFLRKEFPRYGAVFQMLGIFLINLNEMYLKPKLIFNVTDRFQVAAGLDLFSGRKSQVGVAAREGRATDLQEIEQRFQFIGNFSENDRLFLEFKYGF